MRGDKERTRGKMSIGGKIDQRYSCSNGGLKKSLVWRQS